MTPSLLPVLSAALGKASRGGMGRLESDFPDLNKGKLLQVTPAWAKEESSAQVCTGAAPFAKIHPEPPLTWLFDSLLGKQQVQGVL